MACTEVATKDPCFATQACLCDNGYYRVASNMPERPKNYAGTKLYIEQAEAKAAALAEAASVLALLQAEVERKVEAARTALLIAPPPIVLPDEGKWFGFEKWKVIAMGCAVFVGTIFLIALIVWGSIMCCCRKDPDLENRVMHSKSQSRTVFNGKTQPTVTELVSQKFKNKIYIMTD